MVENEDRPASLPYKGAWLWVGKEMIHLMELPNPDPADGRPEHGGRDRHLCLVFLTDLAFPHPRSLPPHPSLIILPDALSWHHFCAIEHQFQMMDVLSSSSAPLSVQPLDSCSADYDSLPPSQVNQRSCCPKLFHEDNVRMKCAGIWMALVQGGTGYEIGFIDKTDIV